MSVSGDRLEGSLADIRKLFAAHAAIGADVLHHKYSDEGMRGVSISPDRTSMAVVDIPIRSTPFTVDPAEALRVVDACTKASGKNGEGVLKVSDGHITITTGSMEASFPLLIPGDAPKMPRLDFAANFEADRSGLSSSLKAIDSMWERSTSSPDFICVLELADGKATLTMRDDSVKVKRDATVTLGPCTGSAKATFTGRLLLDVLSAFPTGRIRADAKDDYPVRLTTMDSWVTVTAMVAPRIEQG